MYAVPFLENLLAEKMDSYYEMLQASTNMNHTRWAKELSQNPYYSSLEESFQEKPSWTYDYEFHRRQLLEAILCTVCRYYRSR